MYSQACSTTSYQVFDITDAQVPYDMQTLDLSAGEHKQPDYLKLQPFGKVPAMEDSDEGVTMFESRSILR